MAGSRLPYIISDFLKRNTMKRILLSLILLFVFSSITDAISQTPEIAYRAGEGDCSLLFNLKGLSDLTASDFNGGLGFQYYFKKHTAFRFSIGMNYDKTITSNNNTDSSYNSINETFGLTMAPVLRFNFASSSNILAYSGICGLINISNTKLSGSDPYGEIIWEKRTTLGLGALMGAEWFFAQNISISAEYQILFNYKFGDKKTEVKTLTSTEEFTSKLPTSTEINLKASDFNFILSFYFK